MADDITITDNLLAAYAEGNVSHDERMAVRKYLMDNPDEMVSILMMMDEDYDITLDDAPMPPLSSDLLRDRMDNLLEEVMTPKENSSSYRILPATAKAAQNIIDNQCVIRCEGKALRQLGEIITDEELLEESKVEGWLQPDGTALHHIGRLSGLHGMGVAHRYNCTLDDIREALQSGSVVIAAVDGGELTGDLEAEKQEDIVQGEMPDHVVVVDSISQDTITLSDSSTPQHLDTYPVAQFLDAWADSSYYLIIINKGEDYDPHPIDLSDVEISDDLIELREAIAENAHEVWAYNRKQEGWKYGSERDDAKKLHPDMIAYSQLPESEKLYDREMAINTIKLVKKLGWDIVKRK